MSKSTPDNARSKSDAHEGRPNEVTVTLVSKKLVDKGRREERTERQVTLYRGRRYEFVYLGMDKSYKNTGILVDISVGTERVDLQFNCRGQIVSTDVPINPFGYQRLISCVEA